MKNFIIKQMRKHNTITKVKNHIDYLLNKNTASHYKSKIHSLTENVKETYKRIYFENEKYITHQKENGGGRPPEASTTYILSIPEDLIHPTNEEWNDIYNKTIENFCNFINENQQRKEKKGIGHIKEENRSNIKKYNAIRLNPDVFKSNSVAVVHNEEDNFEESSHLHIITSNIQDGNYLKMLNQTAGQNYIKKAYDKAVLDTLKLKPQDYIPKCDRLSKEENNQLELEDKQQFEERMKDNPQYKTSEKKKGGRRRHRPSKPQHIARQEEWNRKSNQAQKKIDQVPEAQERIDKANELQRQRKAEETALNAAETAKNTALGEAAAAETKKAAAVKKTKLAQKELKRINTKIRNNQEWLYNIIQSDVVQDQIANLRSAKSSTLDFYRDVKEFMSDLLNENDEYKKEVEKKNPNWLKRQTAKKLKEEEKRQEQLKAQKTIQNEFTEKIELKDEYDLGAEIDKPTLTPKPTLYQRVKRGFGSN